MSEMDSEPRSGKGPGKGKAKAVQPRQVAVAIPYRRVETGGSSNVGEVQVCLVTSRKHDGRYVLPKGGVEPHLGESSRQAAIREMWEEGESGLIPCIIGLLADCHIQLAYDPMARLLMRSPTRLH